MPEVGQLWVNSRIPSFDLVTLWLTGKSCCVKSTQKLGKQEENQERTSDKTPLKKNHVEVLQMQERETTKDFSNKIWLFLQKGVDISQSGKKDRQTEVIALTTTIRADSKQEAYLAALSVFGCNPGKTDMQIGLCWFKILSLMLPFVFSDLHTPSARAWVSHQSSPQLRCCCPSRIFAALWELQWSCRWYARPRGASSGSWHTAAHSSGHQEFDHLRTWAEFASILNALCRACLGGKGLRDPAN